MALRAFEALSPALQGDALNDVGDIFRAQRFPRRRPVPIRASYRSAGLDRPCGPPGTNARCFCIVFPYFRKEAELSSQHRC